MTTTKDVDCTVLPSLLLTTFLLFVWYSCTSACNIFSKLMIKSVEPTNELDCAVTLISLSVSQLFLGVVCGGIATGRVKSPVDLLKVDRIQYEIAEIVPSNLVVWLSQPSTKPEMIAASCHAIGGFCLNLCYLYSSVFIVQVLKCMEPVATMIMSAMFLQEFPSVFLVSSVITIIIGVALVCFKDSTISMVPVVIAVSSNFLYPLRNVLGKKSMQLGVDNDDEDDNNETKHILSNYLHENTETYSSGGIDKHENPLLEASRGKKSMDAVEVFYRVSFLALYLIFPIFILLMLLNGMYVLQKFHSDAWMNLGYSGVTHAVYNIASYGVLSRMQSPTTHAVANVFKRIFTIGSAMMVFGNTDTKLTVLSYIGLAIASIGLIWYQFELTNNTSERM